MSSRSRALPAELARRLLARERDAVAPALNLADDRRPAKRAEALALLEILERDAPFPGAIRTGITGAPGSGKGTQGKILGSIPRFYHLHDVNLS